MKQYTISTDEDTDEFAVKRAILADSSFECLFDISQELRQCRKYRDLTKVSSEDLIDELSDLFYETLSNNGIDLDIYYQ